MKSLLPDTEISDISQLPNSIPCYLIQTIPELKVNGQVVEQGTPMYLGEELPFVYQISNVSHGVSNYTYQVIAGSFLSIAVVAGSISPTIIKADNTKSILESNDRTQISNLTREDLIGDTFYGGTLSYYAQYNALSYILGMQKKGHHNLAAGYGSFGYEPEVYSLFGLPVNLVPGGFIMNIVMQRIVGIDNTDTAQRFKYNFEIGLISSALEHAVPEQQFNSDSNYPAVAISAVKAIEMAMAEGQRIYHITPQNAATTLGNIHHDDKTMSEIRNALSSGKEVITHTDAVTVPGWSGAGYIIYDPVTGDGAFKIGGGKNGAALFWFTVIFLSTTIVLSVIFDQIKLAIFATIAYWEFYHRVKEIAAAKLSPQKTYDKMNEAAALAVMGTFAGIGLAKIGTHVAEILAAYQDVTLILFGLGWHWEK